MSAEVPIRFFYPRSVDEWTREAAAALRRGPSYVEADFIAAVLEALADGSTLEQAFGLARKRGRGRPVKGSPDRLSRAVVALGLYDHLRREGASQLDALADVGERLGIEDVGRELAWLKRQRFSGRELATAKVKQST